MSNIDNTMRKGEDCKTFIFPHWQIQYFFLVFVIEFFTVLNYRMSFITRHVRINEPTYKENYKN